MYSEIYVGGAGEPLTFEEAFEQLKEAYTELAEKNRKKFFQKFGKNHSLVVQIEITGRGAGVFHMNIHNESIEILPWSYDHADAKISASFDHLIGMAKGELSADRLFITGQMKVTGNISKSAEMRSLLEPPKRHERQMKK